MQNNYSIEELELTEAGELNRVAYFESTTFYGFPLNIHQNKLFVYNHQEKLNDMPKRFFRVFDLSVQPMEEISLFWTPEVYCGLEPSVNFCENFIYISFLGVDESHRTAKYSTDNFVFIEYLDEAIGGSSVLFHESFIIEFMRYDDEESIYFLRFSNFINDQKEFLLDFTLPLIIGIDNFTQLYYMEEDNLLIPHINGILVLDLSNILEPSIVINFRVPTEYYLIAHNIIYTEEYIIISDAVARLWIFQIDIMGEYILVNTKEETAWGSNKNLLMVDNFLLQQRGENVKVYNFETSDFNEVSNYGYSRSFRENISPQQNNFYYLEFNTNDYSYNIYSVLYNELIAFVPNIWQTRQWVSPFYIENDILYVMSQRNDGSVFGILSFEIYTIEDQIATLESAYLIPNSYGRFKKIENKILFESTENFIDIYSIINNELIWEANIIGKMDSTYEAIPDNFFINYTASNIYIKNPNDINNPLLNIIAPYWLADISHFHNNYFISRPRGLIFEAQNNIHQYNIENNTMEHIHAFPTHVTQSIGGFNKIITDNARSKRSSEYYSIINNQLVLVGEKEEPTREVNKTFFYPEINKLIQVAYSGIWVYEFEYAEYVADSDSPIPSVKTGLLCNYPNPFNPSTTINLSLSVASNLRVDIYNIKGQKVKTLLNEYKPAGEHSVVWDGKDENGNDMGSGVYLYKMESGDFVSTKKMVLMK